MAIFSRTLPTLPPGRRSFTEDLAANATLLAARRLAATRIAEAGMQTPPPRLDPALGAERAATADAWNALAVRDDVPGAPQVRTVKFLITGVDTAAPSLWLMQSNRFAYHYDFATEALGMTVSLEEFNRETYFRDARANLAGTILHHASFAADAPVGLYALELWPTDPVRVTHVGLAYRLIDAALPFARGHLAYHPAGATHERLYEEERAAYEAAGIRVVTTDTLFAGVTFTPMNLGVGYGTLRILGAGTASRPPTVRDVVIFEQTPNDLSHVAGIVTAAPQTPLSHINLKAKQNGTPNAYVRDASTRADFVALRDRIVRFEVAADGVTVAAATAEEAAAFLDEHRPREPLRPRADLTRTDALPLAELGFADAIAVGAKAANVAELRRILPATVVPDGFALPFSFYTRFLHATGLDAVAKATLASPGFADDAAVRDEALDKLRKKIKKATMPPDLHAAIGAVQDAMHAKFGADRPIRARSSTNNEDLPGFNGAGLYDSYTHRPDEGHLAATVQQVFASLWNFRAYEEREFYRVDHFAAAMAVLLHPNEDDERANGVAYTKNIYDPNWPGFYVNAQLGESLVTNPTPGAIPEEFLISRIGEHGEYELQYIARSSLVPAGTAILARADIDRLVAAMERIQPHFATRYGRADDRSFGMDLEWKIRADGSLQIKQARPTVD